MEMLNYHAAQTHQQLIWQSKLILEEELIVFKGGGRLENLAGGKHRPE